MNTAASSFAESLGLKAAPRSPLAIANSIKAGLPLAALERLSKAIAPDDANFPYRFVPRATLTRRKSASAPKLTLDEGNRVAAVAKVWEFAMEIYRDEERARGFRYRQPPMLENQKDRKSGVQGKGVTVRVDLGGR